MDMQDNRPAQPPATPQVMPEAATRPGSPSPKKRGFLREFFSTIAILVSAFLIALLLIAYVFQSYAVDGPSMEVTLSDQDRLLVWKVPRTWAQITGNQYVPKRGDVVIFEQTGLSPYGQGNDRQLIKRVIGLPGDRVVVKNGTITIYNAEHPNGFEPDETVPYGEKTTIPYTSGNIDTTLAENELFVCGDNRPDSLDSRTFGPITTDQIVGKLIARILPLDKAKAF